MGQGHVDSRSGVVAYSHCGWAGTVSAFLGTDREAWLTVLGDHTRRVSGQGAGLSQRSAWRTAFNLLSTTFSEVLQERPEAAAWGIIFEYEIPRERGRRPDALVLTSSSIAVLEFKDYTSVLQAHIDQVSAYSRDLHEYHSASHERTVQPILVLTRAVGLERAVGAAAIATPDSLADELRSVPGGGMPTGAIREWLEAPYAPLPSLIIAAQLIFRNEQLPAIRRASSAGVDDTVRTLVAIASEARSKRERHLALVTGAPGAGKTLVGLKFVYDDSLAAGVHGRTAVFLSGNGPLITVLQHALKSTVFVQDVHGFLKEYGSTGRGAPSEHIWVYDEAQRAWDRERVQRKNRGKLSEPEDFLALGERVADWALLVGLIGEGQEIHIGEEGGIKQWNDALSTSGGDWIVHCPDHLRDAFGAAQSVVTDGTLALNETLRSHLASDLDGWIAALLDGDVRRAGQIASSVRRAQFDSYATRDLDKARQYVHERYGSELDKRYGLIASSKAKNLARWGVDNSWDTTRRVRQGPWYNDPPTSLQSCCQLRDVVTEFGCQGLELDLPIIGWGSDFLWTEGGWRSPPSPRSQAKDPHQLRTNSYRVLLSRGRDGFIIFLPPEPEMDETFDVLLSAGVVPLADVALRLTA